MAQENPTATSVTPQWPLLVVRLVIGWHFLYEALAKLLYPGWTSVGYLKSSTGPLAGFFHWLASNAAVVRVVDQLNLWALLLVGLGLMLGVFVRPAAWVGMGLLSLYYLAHPPLFAPLAQGVSEGNYLIVNKNLVEFVALLAVAYYPGFSLQWSALLGWMRQPPAESDAKRDVLTQEMGPIPRRQVVASLAGIPVLGAFVLAALKKHGWRSIEEAQLITRRTNKDAFLASATIKNIEFSSRSDLKGRLPMGKIGNLQLSRMILGGNLIGGWAHARDLIYVSKLVRAYHSRDKVFETLALAESCGVNAILTSPVLCGAINDYWRQGGKIKFISDLGGAGTDVKKLMEMVRVSIDSGASACYIHGGSSDRLAETGQFEVMHQVIEAVRKNGLPAGIGGHMLATIRRSVENGIKPDFWMKTLHTHNYWSAVPPTDPAAWQTMDGWRKNDHIWCEDPETVAAYMRGLPQPWLAYKVLAAGALKPEAGFRYAFEKGADFICVGMYDFQIVEDVNIAAAVLTKGVPRSREWYS